MHIHTYIFICMLKEQSEWWPKQTSDEENSVKIGDNQPRKKKTHAHRETKVQINEINTTPKNIYIYIFIEGR